MSVVAITQDSKGGGGNARVVEWYERWAEIYEPDSLRCYLDESSRGWLIQRRTEWGHDRVAVPRMMPLLHVPPYIAGRSYLGNLWDDVDAVHVVGAVCLHGSIAASHIPSTVWMATTIEDERRSVRGLIDRRRSALYMATLPALKKLEARVLRGAERILAMSPYTANLILQRGIPADRVEVRPVPIDTDRFDIPDEEDRSGLLFVGRAGDPRKGVDRAITLVRESSSAREAGLDIVSLQPPPRRLLEDLQGVVHWRSDVQDVADSYRQASIFLLPSRQEGLGIAAFEALACGTPVVGYRCGGADAYLAASGGAELVDGPAEFRSAVERLLGDDGARAEMGSEGRAWVRQHLSAAAFLSDGSIFRP